MSHNVSVHSNLMGRQFYVGVKEGFERSKGSYRL